MTDAGPGSQTSSAGASAGAEVSAKQSKKELCAGDVATNIILQLLAEGTEHERKNPPHWCSHACCMKRAQADSNFCHHHMGDPSDGH